MSYDITAIIECLRRIINQQSLATATKVQSILTSKANINEDDVWEINSDDSGWR